MDASTESLVDFHTHSHFSDGVLSPAALVERARIRNVGTLALTDHDTTAGLGEARAACAASESLDISPQALAYRWGVECAVDRLLLAGQVDAARTIKDWTPPRLPISGGALIQRGLTEGPVVARTLRRIEDAWVAEGFPTGERFEMIVSAALAETTSS